VKILGWANFVFELLAVSFGAVVARGVLLGSLGRRWVIRFLMSALIASIVGLLPFTNHLTAIQKLSMISVYCSGFAMVPLLTHNLSNAGRPVLIVSALTVLYLNVATASILLLKCTTLSSTTAALGNSTVLFTQWVFSASFLVVVILAVRKCRP